MKTSVVPPGLPTSLLVLTTIFSSISAFSYADEVSPVIVTATRTAQTVDESLSAVNVISREDIISSQASDVLDLLNIYAGISFTRNGGPGTTTQLFMRGTNSDHTLVLIDGVRANSATTGSFSWQSLSLNSIEKIEIVRGPMASQYGSDAIGGVIHIFTRQNSQTTMRAHYGSYDTKLAEFGTGAGGDTSYSINASYEGSEGFSATNSNSSSFDPDDDGYRKRSLTASLRHKFSEKAKLSLQGYYNNNKTEYDQGITDNENSTVAIKLDTTITDTWSQSLNLGLARDVVDDTSSFASKFTTDRLMLDLQNDVAISDTQLLTIGLSTRKDEAENVDKSDGSIVYDESIYNYATFVTLQNKLGMHDLLLSGRVDDHSRAGSKPSAHIAWGINISNSSRIIASYGTAFRAPNINELFHPGYYGIGLFAGNPDLKAEESSNFELGFRYKFSQKHRLSVNYYDNTVDNLIAYEGTNSQAININEVNINGAELEYELSHANWSFFATATAQKIINAEDKSDLIRRPRQKASFRLQRKLANKGNINLEWLYSSSRNDYDYSTTPKTSVIVPSYQLVNISARYPLSSDLWLEGRVENLLDEEYELVYSYNTPDRNIHAGISYQF